MTIVAAVDRSDWAPSIVKEAQTLAEKFDEELHVVHVLSESDAAELDRKNVRKTGKSKGRDGIADVAAELAIDAVGESFDGFVPVGLIGKPSARIVDYAGDNDARYIVVGGRKRSPIGKAMFGSDAQSVLLNSDCPVVTVGKTIEDS